MQSVLIAFLGKYFFLAKIVLTFSKVAYVTETSLEPSQASLVESCEIVSAFIFHGIAPPWITDWVQNMSL